jgi:hypothetical protein
VGGVHRLYWSWIGDCNFGMVSFLSDQSLKSAYFRFRFVVNRYMRRVPDQDVEWGYCFDVHLNAFFPMFVLIHVVMPLFFYG